MAEKKKRNYAVDFWRAFATLAVCWGHAGSVGMRFSGGEVSKGTLFTSGPVLGVFLIFTGYFLMKSYYNKKNRGLIDYDNPGKSAFAYLKTRYFGLWPAVFLGCLFGLIVGGYGAYTGIFHGSLVITSQDGGFHFSDLLANFNVNILQWLGLDSTAALADTGYGFNLNSPLWYISAIFITGYFLWWGMCKNEKVMTGFIIPAIVIICPAVWALNGNMTMNDRVTTAMTTMDLDSGIISQTGSLFLGLFDNSLAFAGWGSALGMLLYFPYETFRKMEITAKGKKILTVIHAVLAGYLIYICVFGLDYHGLYVAVSSTGGRVNSEMFVDILVAMTLTFAIAQQDYISTKLLNHKFFGVLGEMALYYFIVHIHIINAVLGLVGGENIKTSGDYYKWLLVINVICIVLGFVFQWIAKHAIQPLMYKLDNNIQRAIKAGVAAGNK